MKKIKFLASVLVAVSSLSAAPELFESIAAIVDGKPIMRSEVMENLYQFQNSAESSKMSEKEQLAFVLDRLIDDKVLLSRVDRDSIQITDDEVELRVTQHLQNLAARQNISMEVLERAVRAQLGMGMAQYRENLGKQVREQMTIGRIRQKYAGGIKPTRKEVSEFYEHYKDSIPRQYNCMRLAHLFLKIEPDSATVDSVRREAEALIDSLDHGIMWELLAKNHSQDSTANRGGDMGYVQKGLLDPAYERAVKTVDNGAYTPQPVRTEQGWSIVRVVGRKEDGIRTAVILLRTIPSSSDSARVLQLADSLRKSLTTDSLFAEAAKKYSADKETNFNGGNLGWVEKSEVDTSFVAALAGLSVGEISEPFLTGNGYHLIRLADLKQVRDYTLDEDYMKVEAFAINYMEDKKLREFVKKWRDEVHIEIRLKE